jgi:hypothetical protein
MNKNKTSNESMADLLGSYNGHVCLRFHHIAIGLHLANQKTKLNNDEQSLIRRLETKVLHRLELDPLGRDIEGIPEEKSLFIISN